MLFNNAIDSIKIGVEDYYSEDSRRSISAVRNIFAGVLLLYKTKLCDLSPDDRKELLIKKNISPVITKDGELTFEGKGKKTVDVQSIKDRFKTFNINVDWKRFDEINTLRNDLEHYYSEKSPNAVSEIVANSFLLIRDFLVIHLKLDPQKVLGNEIWSQFLEITEVYVSEWELCQKSIEEIDWKYHSVSESLDCLRCEKCHSSLIEVTSDENSYPNISLNCKTCNNYFLFESVVEQLIGDSLSGEAIVNAMEGTDSPYDTCLECDKDTFVLEEGCCVFCDYEMEYSRCLICREPLILADQSNEGKCGYCQYKLNKAMSE